MLLQTQQSPSHCGEHCNNQKKEHEPQHWRLEPHVCKSCFARLVSSQVAGSELRLYQCTNCGAEAQHSNADALCCCGLKIRKMGRNGKAGAMVDAGVRCIPNPEPSPLFPNLFVASEVKS